jgi:hypothetical protein
VVMTSPMDGGGGGPSSPPNRATRPAAVRQQGLFPLMQHELITSEGLGTAGSQRRHLLRSVSECKWALSYMHGEPHRSQVVAVSKEVELDKILSLQGLFHGFGK